MGRLLPFTWQIWGFSLVCVLRWTLSSCLLKNAFGQWEHLWSRTLKWVRFLWSIKEDYWQSTGGGTDAMCSTQRLLHYYMDRNDLFGGRITEGRLFQGYLWPNYWSHKLLLGTKWKILTLSFHGYPLAFCGCSGLNTAASQSPAFFQNYQNRWKLAIFEELRYSILWSLFSKCWHLKKNWDFWMKPKPGEA